MRKLATLIPLMLLLYSCAGTLQTQRQLLALINLYNTQYDLFIEQVKDVDPTDHDQIKLLHAKKSIIEEAFPLIMMAERHLDGDGDFSAEDQEILLNLIQKLISL